MNITGNKYLVDFGKSKAILQLQNETSLSFTITERDGIVTNITETVEIILTEIRPGLYMASWKETNGNTVTQIQDYEKGTIYSNWTTTEGEFKRFKGTLKPVE